MIVRETKASNELEKKLSINTPSVEQRITPNWKNLDNYQLYLKRDDLIHPQISGNKWRKLKYQLLSLISQNKQPSNLHIISFGGGYSNHIHALAHCCHQLNVKLTAIIRGDYSQALTPMLTDIQQLGTRIEFVTKIQYKRRNDSDYLQAMKYEYPDAVIIPEGGSHKLALQGIKDMVNELNHDYDIIICPVASAGTFAGLIKNCSDKVALHGIAMLKGQGYLEDETLKLFPDAEQSSNWQIHHHFHCGGYAKKTPELINFCHTFMAQTQIPVEPIYSGKMLYAVKQLIEGEHLLAGSKILTIHTGGLQGQRVTRACLEKSTI